MNRHEGEIEPQHAIAIFDYLRVCARQMRIVTFGEIADECGGGARNIGGIVGWIRENICKPRGLPYLSVIAVRQDTWRPSDGYYSIPEVEDQEEQFQEQVWRGMVIQVFAYDWSQVEF